MEHGSRLQNDIRRVSQIQTKLVGSLALSVGLHLSIEQNIPLLDNSTSKQSPSDTGLERHQTAPNPRSVRVFATA